MILPAGDFFSSLPSLTLCCLATMAWTLSRPPRTCLLSSCMVRDSLTTLRDQVMRTFLGIRMGIEIGLEKSLWKEMRQELQEEVAR